MKKKLLSLILILALALSALTAVGCGSDFSKTYNDPSKSSLYKELIGQTKILNAQTNLDLDYEPIDPLPHDFEDFANLLVFVKNVNGKKSYKVYNFDTNAVVATFDETDTVTYSYVDTGVLFTNGSYYDYFELLKVTTDADNNETREYALYNADGSLFASTNEETPYLDMKIDTFFVNTDYFRVKNGKFEKAGSITKNAMNHIPAFEAANGGRYYDFDMFENEIFVYDSSYTLKSYYKAPSYATNFKAFILNDGNVLVQYQYNVSFYDTDYNYYNANTDSNVRVTTLIFNANDGKTKDVKTEAIFNYAISRDTNYGTPEIAAMFAEMDNGIKTAGSATYIKDKRLDENNETVSISNDGKIEKTLLKVFVAQVGTPDSISEGRFIVHDITGAAYLINADGKILADVTGATYNRRYIVLDGKIYNHDFKELDGFKADDFNVMMMQNSIALRSKTDATKFKLFADGKFTEITLSANQALVMTKCTERYYVISTLNTETNELSYTYYNENGVELFSTTLDFDSMGTARNGKVLLSAYDGANDKMVNIVLSNADKK